MEITKEILEQRIEGLMVQANTLLAQYNQIQGAIAYCHQLIADLADSTKSAMGQQVNTPVTLEEKLPTIEEAVSQIMPGAEILEVKKVNETEI